MSQIHYNTAVFQISSPTLALCPPDEGREVAFAGRSNAGKSSAINTLTRQSKLAKTSKTPGRTQLLNFFALNADASARLVDLPGYGFAKVNKKMKEEWQKHLSHYLQERDSLVGLVLLMDIRHPMQELDATMLNWAIDAELATHILLTKCDKLKKGPAQSTLLKLKEQLDANNLSDLVSVQMFSSLKKQGLGELKERLDRWYLQDLDQGVRNQANGASA